MTSGKVRCCVCGKIGKCNMELFIDNVVRNVCYDCYMEKKAGGLKNG